MKLNLIWLGPDVLLSLKDAADGTSQPEPSIEKRLWLHRAEKKHAGGPGKRNRCPESPVPLFKKKGRARGRIATFHLAATPGTANL